MTTGGEKFLMYFYYYIPQSYKADFNQTLTEKYIHNFNEFKKQQKEGHWTMFQKIMAEQGATGSSLEKLSQLLTQKRVDYANQNPQLTHFQNVKNAVSNKGKHPLIPKLGHANEG